MNDTQVTFFFNVYYSTCLYPFSNVNMNRFQQLIVSYIYNCDCKNVYKATECCYILTCTSRHFEMTVLLNDGLKTTQRMNSQMFLHTDN